MPRPFRVFDSELLEEYPEQGMYAMAYEPLWQSLRASCREQWSQLATARACCARLELYMHRNSRERAVRTWRVFNLLNAVPINKLGTAGIHAIEYAAADYIIAYQDVVRKAFHEMEPPSEWDWTITRHGLIVMYRKNPEWIVYMFRQLQGRPTRGRVKPELSHYLSMNLEIMSSQSDV